MMSLSSIRIARGAGRSCARSALVASLGNIEVAGNPRNWHTLEADYEWLFHRVWPPDGRARPSTLPEDIQDAFENGYKEVLRAFADRKGW